VDAGIGLMTIYVLFIGFNGVLYLKRIPTAKGLFFIIFVFFLLFTINAAITVPMDFNRDLRNFALYYKFSASFYVIHSPRVNQHGRCKPLYWYMRKRPQEFKNLEMFIEIKDQVPWDSYLIFNKDDAKVLEKTFPSVEILKTSKLWNIGRYD
jgi:hypothetical protein